ncbi:MAG: single-stranded DNA-binding protein [bacterium]
MSTARSLNKVLIIGNLTRNPVLRVTANGASVCTFGVATNATWRDSSGNVQERTEFHNIVAWNKLAEICAQLLATGMLVFIEGELRTRTWDDANGVRHYRTEIKIDDMKLLDDKGKKGVGLDQAKVSALPEGEDTIVEETQTATEPKVEVEKTEVKTEEKVVSAEKPQESSDNEGDDLF